MNLRFILPVLLFLVSNYLCAFDNGKSTNLVTIINQWHPGTKTVTTDIEKSKSIPQYENQKNIYLKLDQMIKNKNIDIVLAEGCEGEIDKSFKKAYYGWDIKSLIKKKNDTNYNDIIAHIPMKIEAKYPEIKVLCGDNEKLIKENLVAFSELKGFIGYLGRLTEFKSKDKKKYNIYASSLLENSKNKNVDPIKYAKKMAIKSLNDFKSSISNRNKYFLKEINKYPKKKIALVIGGLHSSEILATLKKQDRPSETFNPKGYRADDILLINELEKVLNNY